MAEAVHRSLLIAVSMWASGDRSQPCTHALPTPNSHTPRKSANQMAEAVHRSLLIAVSHASVPDAVATCEHPAQHVDAEKKILARQVGHGSLDEKVLSAKLEPDGDDRCA